MNRNRFMIRIAGAVLAAVVFVFVGVINLYPAAADITNILDVIISIRGVIAIIPNKKDWWAYNKAR